MRGHVSFDLVGYWDQVGRVLQGRHQTGCNFPDLVFLRPFSFLFGGLTQLHALQIPHQNLPVDGASYNNVGIFGVEFKSEDLER